MNILNLTSSTENLLKCTFCKNYLSHFPVYLSPQDGNICGRCPLPEGNSVIHNVAYETLSQFLQFPCRYKDKGCTQEMSPKNVPQHEKVCKFRIIKCPSVNITKCDWTGSCCNLLEHCKDIHSDIILQNGNLQADLSKSNDIIKFLEHEGKLFINNVKYNLPNKSLQCAVYYMESEVSLGNCWCILHINDKKQEFRVTSFSNIKFTEFPHENVSLSANIDLQKFPSEDKENSEMLTLLKCYICTKFTFPPISQCRKKTATVCQKCKEQHSVECNCWIQFGQEIRNFNLDNIARLLKYPCENRKSGCDYVGRSDAVEKHQEDCSFAEMPCPIHEYVACAWKGLEQEMVAHIVQSHKDISVKNSEILSIYILCEDLYYCNLIVFDNHWFRLVFTQVDKIFYWTVHMIGRFEDNFRYEIELLDKENDGRLVVGNSCSPSVTRGHLLEDAQYYCRLDSSEIKWLSSNTLKFIVRILRQ